MLPGAVWQRCRTHALRSLLTRVPKPAHAMVAALVRTVSAQPGAAPVKAQSDRVAGQLEGQFCAAAKFLTGAKASLPAFPAFPAGHWQQIWPSNGQEQIRKELRRRADAAGIFPDRPALIRLCGAVPAGQHDKRAVARRSRSAEPLATARLHLIACELGSAPKKAEPAALEAVSSPATRLAR